MHAVIETPRLYLREMTRGDLDFMAEMLGDAEVMRFYPHVCSREEAAQWIEKNLDRYAQYGFGLWVPVLKDTGAPIGRVGLIPQQIDGVDEVEIGYMLQRTYWRQGLASEAAEGVREHAFEALGRRRVISLIRPVNIPSQRTALSIGMKPEKKMTVHWNLEHIVFSLQR